MSKVTVYRSVAKSASALSAPAFLRIDLILLSAPHFRQPAILISTIFSEAWDNPVKNRADERKAVITKMARNLNPDLFCMVVLLFLFTLHCWSVSTTMPSRNQIYSLDSFASMQYISPAIWLLKNTHPRFRGDGVCMLPSSFPVSSTGQAYCNVRKSTPHSSGLRGPCI